jgi:hypothetical protein
MSGYNWRDVLGDYAAISGILAGFTLTFVVFILGWSIASQSFVCNISWGQIGVLLNGVSAALFIVASEFLLKSKEHNVWALPDKYEDHLANGFKGNGQDWEKIKSENLDKCLQYEGRGRSCYNLGIFLIFCALFFVIGPYNLAIASVVSGLGIGLELYQVKLEKKPTQS